MSTDLCLTFFFVTSYDGFTFDLNRFLILTDFGIEIMKWRAALILMST